MASVSLYDAIQSHIKSLQHNLYTSLPARVLTYNADKQIVDVEVLIKRSYSDSLENRSPVVLYAVPVSFPSAGGGILSFPVAKGDLVLLVFGMMSIDEWSVGSGDPVTPKDNRRQSINDAIAIAGIGTQRNNLKPHAEDVELKFKDNNFKLKADGTVTQTTTSTWSVKNENEELINVLSEALQVISDITTNTVYGPSPVNNKVDILAIKARLDTFKE